MSYEYQRHLANTIVLRQDAAEYAHCLAKNLMASLCIKPGDDLVPHIGCGTEDCNLQAVESWVYMVCTCLKLPFSADQLRVLESLLEPTLNALSEQLGYSLQKEVSHVG